jgi:uncharacterized protein (UPF0335 family)
MTDTHRVEADQLRAIVERIERTQVEKDDAAEAQKAVYADAKSQGYDPAILRKVIARRKKDRDDLANEEALVETYEAGLE